MRIIRTYNYEQMSEEAAKLVAGQLWLKPASVLGLATGSTPLGLYKKLVDLHDTVGLSFAQTKTFNLDEYVGLTPADEQSYHYFMQKICLVRSILSRRILPYLMAWQKIRKKKASVMNGL